jgi:tetratricopeptide (TPR) repeat protein
MFQLYVEKYGASNIDALMGGFKCLERMKENEEVLDSFLEVGHLFNTFTPLQIEKCKIFLNNSDYENALDYINSKVTIKHFEITKIIAVCNLINDGDYYSALTNIDKMWELLLSQEPKNPELYFSCAQLFSRICEKRLSVIKKCEIMIDKSLEFSPKNSKYLVEKAYYRLYEGEIEKAANIFQQTAEVDANNKDSSIATIYCKILQKKYKEALEDIYFLKDIFVHPKIMYFEAFIRYKQGEKEETVSQTVLEALNSHIKLAKQFNLNKFEILIGTEFDFLFDMTKRKKYCI